MHRSGRLRELLVAGVVDSFGMALGWTVLVLFAVSRGGLAEAALYNAAMLVGVVFAAPVTGWLSRLVTGRTLLRGAAVVEAVLRVGVLLGLVAGLAAPIVAFGVVIMHVAAWAGFAAMRAEVNAVDTSPRAMTRYALCIAAVEAAGTGLGAVLPTGSLPLAVVLAAYAGSLLPTFLAARRAVVTPYGTVRGGAYLSSGVNRPAGYTSRPTGGARHRRPTRVSPVSPRLLLAGGAVMLLASGPTLLAVPLTTELHGRSWVAGAAVAFSLGCLLSTLAVHAIGSIRLPAVLRWLLWGLGMLVGWIYAPALPVMVLFAQFLAGLSQTAFEGDMDALVAEEAPVDGVTAALAYSAATRALGGAVAVRALPFLVAAPALATVTSAAVLVLGVAALSIYAVMLLPRRHGNVTVS